MPSATTLIASPGLLTPPVVGLAPLAPFRHAPLDGLRGLALVAVVLYHVAPESIGGGFLGVESFFVLSGYLLTSLLLAEHARRRSIDRRAYFARRLRRIAPALVALLSALVVFGPLVAPGDAHRLVGDTLSSLAGVTNWHLIADAASYFDQAGRPSFVRHLWSIAIEIQFYVVCPFLVGWLARRRRGVAMALLVMGIAVSAAVMALRFEAADPSRAYYGTDARVGALLAGVLLAVALVGRSRARVESLAGPRMSPIRPIGSSRSGRLCLGWTALGLAALVTLMSLYLLADDRAGSTYPAAFLATQAATVALIVTSLRSGPLARLLGFPPLAWLGQRSYGIYLWHWPAVVLLRPEVDVSWSPVVTATATIGFAVVAGSVSYSVIERPVLTGSPRPGRRGARRGIRPALAGVLALALAAGLLGLPTTDPLAQTLSAGERALAEQDVALDTPAPSSPAPATAVGPPAADTGPAPATAVGPPAVDTGPAPTPSTLVAPDQATPAREPPPDTAGPETTVEVPVVAVGDSVMVSAAVALRDRLGPQGLIDASNSRQFDEGVALARVIRERGGAQVVVVHLGNNGPIDHEGVDAVLAELAGIPEVLLVNVRVSARWQDEVNQVLAEAAAHHPGVTLVDWYGRSAGHRDWFQSDGTHFRTISGPGANAYADLIVSSIPQP